MKWNWGTGIVLGMIGFIAFIMFMVITMLTDSDYDHDLVTENYYAKEMAYQDEIDQEKRLESLSKKINGKRTKEGWLIEFPEEINEINSSGTVFLYRPSNQKLDTQFDLKLSGSHLLIPDNKLVDGRWNITIEWTTKDNDYLYKESILY
ncbi:MULTISPECIES: FixH family protein [Nonlabens]|uniref:FixH family protein n=1 Tax=Nonlabens TaxID=363408 RepID=UPI000A208D19|nr:FixH family protein [Nonlabens tegetincola]ARN71533.1 cytochrome C oxidase Cbb3 [Nonlabens tegetincola]MEE2801131.1 FixH family protein [Bacteroidota bacterium]PQJ14037.1 cytochrome C oxidase Cbb3 [Nonlabens tegetincola]